MLGPCGRCVVGADRQRSWVAYLEFRVQCNRDRIPARYSDLLEENVHPNYLNMKESSLEGGGMDVDVPRQKQCCLHLH